MKLEDQVCSLELSEKLKELGVKQESIWYFQHTETLGVFSVKTEKQKDKFRKTEIVLKQNISNMAQWICSAFTVAELGEMLPNFDVQSEKFGEFWYINKITKGKIFRVSGDKNEANARAEMLIYLIEKGYIKVGEKL